jgi:hypothetical protein
MEIELGSKKANLKYINKNNKFIFYMLIYI